MSNIFYRYNPQTLVYERVFPSYKQRIWSLFRQLIVGIFIGGGIFAIATYAFDSPHEQQLKKENKLLLTQYEILSRRISESQKVLDDLQQRDDQLYRALFNADPIPESVRRQGFGGTNRYESLLNMPNSELVISTTRKLDMMTKELYVQSNSYDELAELITSKEDRIKCIPAIQPIANKELKRISSGFGTRIHPIYNTRRFHSGVDFTANIGTPIYATGNGTIEFASRDSGYGNCIVINHGFGYKTRYAHCKDLKVKVGQKVVRGEVIATLGNTGVSTGPHLHYEVIFKGQYDNPAKYFFMDLTPEEYDQIIQIADNHGSVMD